MKADNITNWIKLDYEASSLYSVMADGTFRATSAGRSAWKTLINGSSLQLNCNKEGFNIKELNNVQISARLGLIANNEYNCLSSDSWIGYGVSYTTTCILGFVSSTSCGNEANCLTSADNGDKTIAAFGYFLVQ